MFINQITYVTNIPFDFFYFPNTYTFHCFSFNFNQNWNNHLLKWNASEYGGIKTINVSPTLIWLPDIVLHNK